MREHTLGGPQAFVGLPKLLTWQGVLLPVMLPGDRPVLRVAVPSWKLYGWSIRTPPED